MGLFDRLVKKPRPSGPDPEILALIEQLEAPDWETRHDAATRLGALGARSEDAMAALEEATSDDNDEVCTAAADALSSIRRALLGR